MTENTITGEGAGMVQRFGCDVNFPRSDGGYVRHADYVAIERNYQNAVAQIDRQRADVVNLCRGVGVPDCNMTPQHGFDDLLRLLVDAVGKRAVEVGLISHQATVAADAILAMLPDIGRNHERKMWWIVARAVQDAIDAGKEIT